MGQNNTDVTSFSQYVICFSIFSEVLIATRVKRVVDTFVCIIHMPSNRPLTTTTNEQMLVRRLEDSSENMHSLSCLGTYSIYIPSSKKHYYY